MLSREGGEVREKAKKKRKTALKRNLTNGGGGKK